MSKLNNLIENRLLPVAGKLGTSRILTVLRDAFMLAFPITVVGSLALVIMNIPYLDKVIGEEALTALKNVLGILPSATMSITTLFVVMAIGYYYAKSYDVDPIFPAVISIVSFLILTPLTVTTEAGELVNDIIPIARLGAKGMFVGIFASFLVTRLYILILSKDWTIKMPEGVPPTVAKSFASLIPTVIVLLSVVIVRTIFTFTPWGNIHDFIYEIIQMPLTSLGSGLVATLAAIFSVQIL